MTTSLAPLRDEHRELLPHIDQLRTTADRIGAMPRVRLIADVRSSIDFLTRHLRPHADVEDAVLYPEVARVMGAPTATDTMRRDHDAIARLTDELAGLHASILATGEITRTTQNELRRVLYGLHALITVHFDKEEEVYIPLVEARLDDAQARRLLDSMQSAHTQHEHDDPDTGIVADALNTMVMDDRPGVPAEVRPDPMSPASDAEAPAP
jgi:iron-sulfur cluster repair protein YtfE (RIC family)